MAQQQQHHTHTVLMESSDNVFGKPTKDYTWTNAYNISLNTTSQITDRSLSYEVPKLAAGACIFLDQLVISMVLRLVDKDGNKPADKANVAPVNLFSGAMFRSVRIYLNETETGSTEGGIYPLKCYTDTLLNYNSNQKFGPAQMYGWHKDTAGNFQNTSDEVGGYNDRRCLFGAWHTSTDASGKRIRTFKYSGLPVPVYSRVVTDFSSCRTPLISGVSVRIEALLNEPSFYLISPDADAAQKGYRLKIDSAVLLVPVRTLAAGLSLDLERKLSSQPIAYQLRRVEEKKLEIAASLQSFSTDNLYQSSILPNRTMLMLVPTALWEGGYKTNPFEANVHFEGKTGATLTNAVLSVNGSPLEQEPNENLDQFVLANFRRLYKHLGLLDSMDGPGITLHEFISGFQVISFDLTASNRSHITSPRQPCREGHARLQLNFSQPLDKSVNLFCISEYFSTLLVDKQRNFTYKFIA